MFFGEIARVLNAYFWIFALILVVPLVFSFLQGDAASTYAFFQTALVTMTVATFFGLLGKGREGKLYKREGIILVAFIWFLTPFFGSLPFLFTGVLHDPAQAYFEAASGFTTTGATVFEGKHFDANGKEEPIERAFEGIERVYYSYYGTVDPVKDKDGKILLEGIEAVPKGLLFWRSMTQWLGGLGIMILFVAVLPAIGVGGKLLYQSEATGPVKESFTPRIKETALRLWLIYVGFSLLQLGVMYLVKPDLPFFDAIILVFSTISTGGFTIKNGNIAAYHSPGLEWVLIIFMVLGSINFALYHYILKKRWNKLRDPELYLYLSILLIISCLASWMLLGTTTHSLETGEQSGPLNWSDAIRLGTFQMISGITSTGYSISNYDYWPYEVQVLLLTVMYLGGMSGSTAGGLKISRLLVLLRVCQNKIETIFRPDTIRALRIGGKEVGEVASTNTLVFFFLFVAISVMAVLFYTMEGIDPETSLGMIACNINNTGLAFRQAGPSNSFAFLSTQALLLSSFWMILGRLELFVILVLFIPAFWREEY